MHQNWFRSSLVKKTKSFNSQFEEVTILKGSVPGRGHFTTVMHLDQTCRRYFSVRADQVSEESNTDSQFRRGTSWSNLLYSFKDENA